VRVFNLPKHTLLHTDAIAVPPDLSRRSTGKTRMERQLCRTGRPAHESGSLAAARGKTCPRDPPIVPQVPSCLQVVAGRIVVACRPADKEMVGKRSPRNRHDARAMTHMVCHDGRRCHWFRRDPQRSALRVEGIVAERSLRVAAKHCRFALQCGHDVAAAQTFVAGLDSRGAACAGPRRSIGADTCGK